MSTGEPDLCELIIASFSADELALCCADHVDVFGRECSASMALLNRVQLIHFARLGRAYALLDALAAQRPDLTFWKGAQPGWRSLAKRAESASSEHRST
jgi:hypothetical protein